VTPGLAASASPVAGDQQLGVRLDAVKRVHRMERDLAKLQRRSQAAASGLVEAFERRLQLLEDRGYARGWSLTARGERLRFVYNELDLLLAEAAESGLLSELGPAELAALASMFIFEARQSDVIGDWPNAAVATRGEAIYDLSDELAAAEDKRRISVARPPDAGFAEVAFNWTAGALLEDLFDDDEVGAGDFVRNMRQLVDLLRQLRDAYPELADTARAAIKVIDRGVVAAGGQV
jgi:ATP-dependent RNA helicase HelY